jgi:transposase
VPAGPVARGHRLGYLTQGTLPPEMLSARAPAVGDDLRVVGQAAESAMELVDRHRAGPGDVARGVLGHRADVQHEHAAVAHPLHERGPVHRLELAAITQRAVMDAEITGDLSDRPAGLQDHLHRLSLLVTEIRHLDRRSNAANTEIADAVQASRSTLTELRGIGDLTAGKILARVGDVHRFRSAAAFASYTGTAPIEVSSGDVVRHRLSRAGDRQLNCCLHTMAITQTQRDSPGRAYYLRKRADGKSHKEALRCLKRRLSDAVYRCLIRDAEQQNGADPGGHQGATTKSSAAGSTPTTGSSDKSLPGPATTDPTT